MRILGVIVTPDHLRPVQQSMRQVALLGGGGLVLTTRPLRAVLPDGIDVVDLSQLEEGMLLSRVERALALHVPAAVLRVLHRVARAGDLLGRLAPVDAPLLRPRVEALQDRHRVLARRSRSGPYAALWRLLGPWYVARRLDGDGLLARLDLDSFDGIVVPDDDAVPVAARVLRRRPGLTAHNRWTPQRVVRVYADRVRRA